MKVIMNSLICGMCCAMGAFAQETLWTYQAPVGFVDTSPGIGDLNGDGSNEIVLSTTAGLVVALDHTGRDLWVHGIPGHACFPPSVANVNGDAALEVLAMNELGHLVCLKGSTGEKIWEANLPSRSPWGTTAPATADVDGDGAPEIVLGSENGLLMCVRGSGDLYWTAQIPCRNMLCPAIADLDGDARPEILAGGEGVPLVCLSGDGKERWRLEGSAGSSPFVFDLDQQGTPEIVVSIRDRLHVLDAQGKTIWSVQMQREMDSALAIADANGDNEPEIYAIDLSGYMVSLTPRGLLRWSANVEARVRRSPSIGDVDGDGAQEILVAGYSGAIHVFDPDGRLEQRVPVGGAVNATATLATLGDAGLCVIVPVGSGAVQVLRWPGVKPDAQVLWPEFRHDSRRAGTVTQAAGDNIPSLSVDFGPMYVGTNCVRAVVSNPGTRSLALRLEATRAGIAPISAESASSEELIEQQLWYTVPGSETANLSFLCTVSEGSRVLCRQARTACTIPFVKELADAENGLREVERLCAKLPDTRGIEDRAFFLRGKLDGLRGQVAIAGTLKEDDRIVLRDALAGILSEMRSLLGLATAAGQALAAGGPVQACPANPWAPFGGMDEWTEGRAASWELHAELFRGETESAALNVFNFSSQSKTFVVELESLSRNGQTVPGKDAITFFETVDVPTEMRRLSPDALPRLNSANLLLVPAWGARQLWMNIDGRALEPGDWTGTLRLRSLELVPLELRQTLGLTVWSTALPEKWTLRNCSWGYVHSSPLKEYPEQALEDQVRHGTNVFVGTFAPKATFDASGNLVGEIDFTQVDDYVRKHSPHGIILFCGYQGALQGPAPIDSEAYGKAHVQWLRAWVKHLAELGVGYDGFALYPVDEPGLSVGLVDLYLRMARLAREADPKILMYTDPVERITVEELHSMVPYVDIWCPSRSGLVLLEDSAEKMAVIMQSGKVVWTYECFGNVKHHSPIAYYRAQAWLAWQQKISGIGFWTYCTTQDNPWFLPAVPGEYMLVYPGNGIVTSKRWEAVRDGMEDHALLSTLRDAVNAQATTAAPADLDAARHLLDEQAAGIGAWCIKNTDDIDPDRKGMPEVRRREDLRWIQLQAVRSELARLLQALVK